MHKELRAVIKSWQTIHVVYQVGQILWKTSIQ